MANEAVDNWHDFPRRAVELAYTVAGIRPGRASVVHDPFATLPSGNVGTKGSAWGVAAGTVTFEQTQRGGVIKVDNGTSDASLTLGTFPDNPTLFNQPLTGERWVCGVRFKCEAAPTVDSALSLGIINQAFTRNIGVGYHGATNDGVFHFWAGNFTASGSADVLSTSVPLDTGWHEAFFGGNNTPASVWCVFDGVAVGAMALTYYDGPATGLLIDRNPASKPFWCDDVIYVCDAN